MMRFIFTAVFMTFVLTGCTGEAFRQGFKTSRDVLRAACKAEKVLTAIQEKTPLSFTVGGVVDTASAAEDQVTVTIEMVTD